MLNITYRNLDSSPTIHDLAEELMAKLVRTHGEPARAHLVVEDASGGHAHCENRFAAHLELSIAHASMNFQSQSAGTDAAHVVREAFDRVETQIVRQNGKRESHRRERA